MCKSVGIYDERQYIICQSKAVLSLQKKILLALAAFLIFQAIANLIKYFLELRDGGNFGADFIVFWHAGQHVYQKQFLNFYDTALWQKILNNQSLYTAYPFQPFAYPPTIALLLWPLGTLSYNTAVALWTVIPLILYYALLFLFVKPTLRDTDKTTRNYIYLLVAASMLPAISANMFTGQIGTWMGVLFLGFFYYERRYPVIAGLCIGLIAIKPQLTPLLPFALIASSRWRIILTAACLIITMIVVTTAWLSIPIWADYMHMSVIFSGLINNNAHWIGKLAPGPYIALHGLGVPVSLAITIQGIISLVAVAAIIQVYRDKNSNQNIRQALLAAGILLVPPYSMCYDTPILAVALLPLLAYAWQKGLDNLLEVIAVMAIIIMPYAQPLLYKINIPFGTLSLLLLFAALYRKYINEKRGGNTAYAFSTASSTLSSS